MERKKASAESRVCIRPKVEGVSSCKPPLCAACLLANMKRRSDGIRHIYVDEKNEMALKKNDLKSGDYVSLLVSNHLPLTEDW